MRSLTTQETDTLIKFSNVHIPCPIISTCLYRMISTPVPKMKLSMPQMDFAGELLTAAILSLSCHKQLVLKGKICFRNTYQITFSKQIIVSH